MALIDNQLFTQTNPSGSSLRTDHAEQHTALNNETNSIEDTLVQGYVREAATVTYVSASSFTVSGDVTAIYTAGRIVRFSDGTTGVVTSSSYSAPNTTVNIVSGTVPSTLSYVDIAIQPEGGTNKIVDVGTAQTITGAKTFSGENTFQKTVQTWVTATDGATVTFDLSQGNLQKVTLGGNRTLAVSNVSVGQCFIIKLIQDATGSRTVTWWSGISWAGGSAPTLTTTANKADVFGFVCTGTNTYDGFIVGTNL